MENTKCVICFEYIKNPAHPDTCFHTFCTKCLLKWSKQCNQCPHDRKSFNSIVNSITNEKIKVRHRKKRRHAAAQYDVSVYCDLCAEHPANEIVILCDSCSLGFHLKCLNPPLYSVPSGSWQCPECVKLERKIRYKRRKGGRRRHKRKNYASNVNFICSGKVSSSDTSNSSEEETTASDSSAAENSSGISSPSPFLSLPINQSSKSVTSSASSSVNVIDFTNLPSTSTSENVQMHQEKDPTNVITSETPYEINSSSSSSFNDVMILDDKDIFLSSDTDEERRVETKSVVTFAATERDTSNLIEGNESDSYDDVSVLSKELAEYEEETKRTMNYDWKRWCKTSITVKKKEYLGNPISTVSSEDTYPFDGDRLFKVPIDAFSVSTGGISSTENQKCIEKNTSLISDTHNDVTFKDSLRPSTSYSVPSLDNQISVPSLSSSAFPSSQSSENFMFNSSLTRSTSTSIEVATSNSVPFHADFYSDQNDRRRTRAKNSDTCSIRISSVSSCRERENSNTSSLSPQNPIMELPHSIVSFSTNSESSLVPQYSEVKTTQPSSALIDPKSESIQPHSSSTPVIYPPLKINGLTYLSFDPARGMNDPNNIIAMAELRKHFHPNFLANYYIHDKR